MSGGPGRSGGRVGSIARAGLLGLLLLGPVLLAACAARPADGAVQPAVLTVDDIRREMGKARGRVLIAHLWATWCAPCLDDLPLIEGFARAARARGAVVMALALDSDARGIARVPSVLRARAPGLPAAVAHFTDPEPFIALFSKSWQGTIPASFVFDRAGKLHAAVIGGAERPELDALLDELLPPRPDAAPPERQPAPPPR